jgi:hypothetical protein
MAGALARLIGCAALAWASSVVLPFAALSFATLSFAAVGARGRGAARAGSSIPVCIARSSLSAGVAFAWAGAPARMTGYAAAA